MMAFTRRKIQLTFILGTGAFGEGGQQEIPIPEFLTSKGNNAVTVAGLRVKAHISNYGGFTMGTTQLQVYGLIPDLLNQLSVFAQYSMYSRKNKVIVAAGDEGSPPGVVFEGTITQAWVDANTVPDAVLHVVANAGAFQLVKPIDPSSYPGPVKVSDIMANLALQMKMGFVNEGVDNEVTLAKQYLPGTAWQQVQRLAEIANIDYVNELDRTLIILPKGSTRGQKVPLVSAATGMIGYPIHDSTGVIVNMLFSRDINLLNQVQVQSTLKNATGKYRVIAVSHDLESETPGGEWYTHFQGATLDHPHARPTLN